MPLLSIWCRWRKLIFIIISEEDEILTGRSWKWPAVHYGLSYQLGYQEPKKSSSFSCNKSIKSIHSDRITIQKPLRRKLFPLSGWRVGYYSYHRVRLNRNSYLTWIDYSENSERSILGSIQRIVYSMIIWL